MNKPLVLLDVDGVLADFVGAYLDTLHAVTGQHRTREEIYSWSIEDSLGLSEADGERMVQAIITPDWCLNIPVLPGAQRGVAALRKVADVHIVTSPWTGRYWAGERLEWLHRHFGILARDVTQTRAKYLLRGDAIVDDKMPTLEKWRASNFGGRALLWDTPHNRRDHHPGVKRITSWGALIEAVQRAKAPVTGSGPGVNW